MNLFPAKKISLTVVFLRVLAAASPPRWTASMSSTNDVTPGSPHDLVEGILERSDRMG